MVRVDRRRAPVGHFVRFPVPRGEGRALLLLLEDLERPPAGRPVDALPRHLQAPAPGGGAHLGEVAERGALEEALAHVGDAGPAHARGVGDEAAVAGVLQEAPREARVQRVGHGHGGREVIDDEVAGHALEAGPGRLQSLDHRVQRLAGGGPDEAVPRVAPDHDSAHTVRRRPVSGSVTRPRRPKSISVTSPGGPSSMRTVPRLRSSWGASSTLRIKLPGGAREEPDLLPHCGSSFQEEPDLLPPAEEVPRCRTFAGRGEAARPSSAGGRSTPVPHLRWSWGGSQTLFRRRKRYPGAASSLVVGRPPDLLPPAEEVPRCRAFARRGAPLQHCGSSFQEARGTGLDPES